MHRQNDPLLDPLLTAASESSASSEIETLIRRAEPVLATVIGYYKRRSLLDANDADEVLSRVQVRLFLKLRRLHDAAGEEPPIASFTGYVAGLAYNTVNDLFRERHPRRAHLQKRIREAISAGDRFKLEHSPNGLTCRLVEMGYNGPVSADTETQTLERLLRDAGGAMAFNDVVNALDQTLNVTPPAAEPPDPFIRFERRSDVESLWSEIRQLRPLQRAALLLNLRDDNGGNAIALFLLIGIATFDDVARAVGISGDDLAAIWNDLPLDDRTIATRLGVTRQNVINLRQAARQRLTRRRR